ncbi:FG-GAP-like repeat-containing protein [uncultured Maribacter sp.]|uniref:FG-GAP-like repeat-containing protein n=1 Tax=uncultured Maribacter sp. TaxID=431308 RepID=UPI00260FA4C3|nr:FG-GAP-like repeat-containing protein [uncultured Maribacter sp.]
MKKKHISSQIFLCLFFTINFINSQVFKEISKDAGISSYCKDSRLMSGGTAFIDYNNDNYQDILLIGGENGTKLYKNNWDNSFTDVSNQSGLIVSGITTMGVIVGDTDNDGDEDIFITTNENSANLLFINNGDGTFINFSKEAGINHVSWSTSASFGDYNLDGLLDIYVVNYVDFVKPPFDMNIKGGQKNFLYKNIGNNTFEEVAEQMGVADIGCGLATTFTDCDNDGDLDIMVANDFGYKFFPNELYINEYPLLSFKKIGKEAKVDAHINAMGVAIGDYDKDLDLDYYITNMSKNPFYENINEAISYKDVSEDRELVSLEGTSWGTVFFDYNNDTDLDLFVANGEIMKLTTQDQKNKLYKGIGGGFFKDISLEAAIDTPENCRGLSSGDIDNDGDLDILLGVVSKDHQTNANTLLYENQLQNENNFLAIKLEGTMSNKNGYGSRISLETDNETLIREVDGGSSYLSTHSNIVHFGLGDSKLVKKIVVEWMGGKQDVFTNIPINVSLKIIEGQDSWIQLKNKEQEIVQGDSINILGDFIKKEGIYKDIIKSNKGKDSIHVYTKLKIVLDTNPVVKNKNSPKALLYPNPITNKSVLKYTIEKQGNVKIFISDISGRIKLLFEGYKDAGENTLEINDANIFEKFNSSGVYFFLVKTDNREYIIKGVFQ